VIEQRKFHRLPISTNAVLRNYNELYQGQLENISMSGALIRLKHGTSLLQGEIYDLEFYLEGDDTALLINAEVICVNFSMAGIKFCGCSNDAVTRLSRLMELLESDPDLAVVEHERVRRRLANYLRDEK
jgi:hypothetical protein